MNETELQMHAIIGDCLSRLGGFDENGISEDGTAYIVNDGKLYRVTLEHIPGDDEA